MTDEQAYVGLRKAASAMFGGMSNAVLAHKLEVWENVNPDAADMAMQWGLIDAVRDRLIGRTVDPLG